LRPYKEPISAEVRLQNCLSVKSVIENLHVELERLPGQLSFIVIANAN
jgi:hypothetical protein